MATDSFRAYVAETKGEGPKRGVTTMATDDLPADGVLVAVAWSSVNYKDALASTPTGKVARISPMVPGIDLAGTIVESDDDRFPTGTEVVAHGYDLGVSRHGGFAEYARVPVDWLVPVPAGLGLRDTMVIGTAGYTAALSVLALEEHGLVPGAGPVLVTGATGGVGSTAVGILAARGYEVVASTGKADAEPYLRSLGAKEIVERSTLGEGKSRPLESTVWAAAVDCVGSTTLANVLPRIEYGGAVACSGVTGGGDLPATMMPFVLRGVSLLGIDSVQTPIERRRQVWERLGADLKPVGLADIGHDVGLGDLDAVLDAILKGAVTGRTVVDVRR
jgi:putative YhdH/YhfP family quinone oxidoreductase